MRKYIINGGRKLSGEVFIGGSKNATLPAIAAAIIPNEPVVLKNVPEVSDVYYMLDALKELGATVSELKDNIVTIDGSTIDSTKVSLESMRNIRASYYLIGALLARNGEAQVPVPGGCSIGNRPIDQHIRGFRKLGANIKIENGDIIASTRKDSLYGATIFMDVTSVGATINVMLAASTAKGITTIINAAREPHVSDVANMLVSMGVKITGINTDKIRIFGTRNIKGTVHTVIPDQIEAATFLIAAAATGSTITVRNTDPCHLAPISAKLIEAGCTFSSDDSSVTISAPDVLTPITVITNPHPGFPTDCQPQISAALTKCLNIKSSVVKENIFSGRYKYVAELVRMGADIKVIDRVEIISGVPKLTGAEVDASDLRAGAALIIAGLMAEGQTIITNAHYVERGYTHIEQKLRNLGADIKITE